MKNLQKFKQIILYKLFAIFGINVLLTSCTPNKFDVNFKVKNWSSSDIFVEYVNLSNNNDTNTVQIISSETQIISTANAVITDEWYWVNEFSINHIVNLAGDTINFNPNAAYYWIHPEHDYILDINNSSF